MSAPITLNLTAQQARLVSRALNAELRHLGTLIDEPEAVVLRRLIDAITTALETGNRSLMSRVERAVEDYCDACDYTSYRDLTAEDIDYLAAEQQISPREFRELLALENL